jgi:hypothetical protein
MFFGAYLIASLKAFPKEYRNAGSPTPFWNNGAAWAFLGYVLAGRFIAVPDAGLVSSFKVYRAFELVRLGLFILFVLLLLASTH